ncbi:MAG: DUF1549 and DUF1553 domain-containing protein [Gemmataceae bacterium]|nr:DUF1549 and DUF1553 domain-containing protein [Gemmataceae bacterium]MDW8265824.1 DUF1549 and DUF1553 domain-containing protein [Gemmataceae bacterium]
MGAVLGTLVVAVSAEARPAHKAALVGYLGSFLDKRLNDCRTCHRPDGTREGIPLQERHNPFGARLAALRAEALRAGSTGELTRLLDAVADEDSDGDGVPNLMEMVTGHFPGDADDVPNAAAVAAARKTLAEFAKSRSAYAWRPFEPVQRPVVPAVHRRGWVRNPIDAFIAAEHESRGLQPRPEAPKAVLLRRVYLDLIGLPPTPEELHAFLNDSSADAYEKVVERLLQSPHYGERWGRHWMDVWRYSDWAGFGPEVRDSQPHIWRWRDWIVESLNQDKGYDRMILEMLAGDELAPEDPDTLRATGYLVRNFKRYSREKWLQDTVEHTAQAFVGITLGCARCHDHFYDPITQHEYYQVRAIFEPHHVRIDRLPGQPDVTKDGLVRAFDAQPEVPTYLLIRGDDRTPDKSAPIPPGVPRTLGGKFPTIAPIALPRWAVTPDKRPFVIEETIAAERNGVEQARQAVTVARRRAAAAAAGTVAGTWAAPAVVRRALDAISLAEQDVTIAEGRLETLLKVLRVESLEDQGRKDSDDWKEAAKEARAAQLRQAVAEARRNLWAAERGLLPASGGKAAAKIADLQKALAQAEAEWARPPATNYKPRSLNTYPATSTGRRLAFARWLADRSHPLTARVAMNHIWLRHFGQAIVPTVFDFGRNGRPPSHPALLDWLAAEFMDQGWSMKAMHRLIVTSSTYRQASTPDPANAAIDRDNRYLWRMPPRRLEAEAVRDALLFVGGELDPKLGGPDIDHNLGLTVPRRSLYFRHAQEKQMEFLKIFDCASVTESYQRKESVLPQQALALANSELTVRLSRGLAQRLSARVGTEPVAFVRAAFEQVLSRPPTDAELAECVAFLEAPQRVASTARTPGEAAARARESLVHVLLNHHDFVTIR